MKCKAIPEIKNYFSQVKIELGNFDIYFSYTERESVSIMKYFFEEIFIAIDDLHKDSNFTIFVMENLVESNSNNNQNFHLPNIVFSYIKPTVPTQSIKIQHSSLRESFRYANVIGLSEN